MSGETYENVLVPTDGSTGSDAATEHGALLAATAGATLHGLFAVDLPSPVRHLAGAPAGAAREQLRVVGDEALADLERRGDDAGLAVRTALREERPADAILGYVDDESIDVVVMGTHGRTGLDRHLLGSVTESVTRRARVPVLTVRDEHGTPTDYDEVLVGVDGTPGSSAAVDHALAIADLFDATVHAAFVVDVRPSYRSDAIVEELRGSGETAAEEVAQRAAERDLDATTTVREGVPSKVLRQYADEADIDLLAVGAHGENVAGRHVGNTAARLIRIAPSPVLIARAAAAGDSD